MSSPWDQIQALLGRTGSAGHARARSDHYNSVVKKHTPAPPPNTELHAILDSSKRVMALRAYPRTTRSNNVIPIPEDTPVAIGWLWDGKTFRRPSDV